MKNKVAFLIHFTFHLLATTFLSATNFHPLLPQLIFQVHFACQDGASCHSQWHPFPEPHTYLLTPFVTVNAVALQPTAAKVRKRENK